MFNFREELAKYRESLEVEDLSEGLSGDEIQDILDVAKALVREQKQTAQGPQRPDRKQP